MPATTLLQESDLTETGGRRRLAAILAADVAGYSRLMSADEDATVVALDAARAACQHWIAANQGRVIDMAGDSVLAIFETATGAVHAALSIQHQLESSAEATAQDRRMRFRIGVHLGDVIEKADGTVYGDGVNIAARLQTLAEPGGVAVSSTVQETVRDRVAARFEDQGEHVVKNISRPVRAFRVVPGAPGPGARLRLQRPWRLAALLVIALTISVLTWMGVADSAREVRASLATLLGKRAAVATPDSRARIAVMPFANQGADPQRDYFSDGITEDIIGALGRFSGLMVMARNAVQPYKGRSVPPAEVSQALGVRYLVQGSVRQSGDILRVTVELSDAEKGLQLWSEHFEGNGRQVFELQDQIVRNIVGALAVKLSRLEQQRVFAKPTDSLEAYDLVLRARALLHSSGRSSNRDARQLLAQALQLAPDYAAAYVVQAQAELQRVVYGWVEDVEASIQRSEALALKALALDDRGAHARAHGQLGSVYVYMGKYDQALAEVNRALEMNGSDSAAYARRGSVLLWLGRIDEAVASMETSQRFDPQLEAGDEFNLAFALYMAGRTRDAVASSDRGLLRFPEFFNLHVVRAMALAELDDTEGARASVEAVQRRSPFFQAAAFGTRFARSADQDKVQRALRKAGF